MSFKRPKNPEKPKPWQYGLALAWGTIVIPVGLVLCVIPPVGIALIYLGAKPLLDLIRRWSWAEEALPEYDEQGEEMALPWMMVEDVDVDVFERAEHVDRTV